MVTILKKVNQNDGFGHFDKFTLPEKNPPPPYTYFTISIPSQYYDLAIIQWTHAEPEIFYLI